MSGPLRTPANDWASAVFPTPASPSTNNGRRIVMARYAAVATPSSGRYPTDSSASASSAGVLPTPVSPGTADWSATAFVDGHVPTGGVRRLDVDERVTDAFLVHLLRVVVVEDARVTADAVPVTALEPEVHGLPVPVG